MFKNDWWQLKRKGYSIYGTKYYFEATTEKLDLSKETELQPQGDVKDLTEAAEKVLKQVLDEPMRERVSKLDLTPGGSIEHSIDMESEAGYFATLNYRYFKYFQAKYRSPDFYITGKSAPVLVVQNNKIIGGVMPLRSDR